MVYMSVKDAAQKWNLSERSIRKYCVEGRVSGAMLVGTTWMIPDNAEKPKRKTRSDAAPDTLLNILQREKEAPSGCRLPSTVPSTIFSPAHEDPSCE